MDPTVRTKKASVVMMAFAKQTGLLKNGKPRRYLWTDAFAVCNFLTLYRRSGDDEFRRLALDLVDQVHAVLGRHRDDDPRTSWISGLDEATGARHPTAGGLRIGKALNERSADEAYDERLEWDRDGQYFHYLTKWMHALARVGMAVAEPKYVRWALELAKASHAAFAYGPVTGGEMRMYWKMSIDLSRPVVPSMGLHDPLDAYVTYNELRYCASQHPGDATLLDISDEISEARIMCEKVDFTTDDPLGIGGLLFDACRLVQMSVREGQEPPALLEALLRSSKRGLDAFLCKDSLNDPVNYRLAFRELGLSIGLRAIERIWEHAQKNRSLFNDALFHPIESLTAYQALIEPIERFWCDANHQHSQTWREHGDISTVMLATSLSPEGFLSL